MLYIFLAEGFEETEAIGTIDVIRRANLEIKTVGVDKKSVTGSHGITVECDLVLGDISDDYDGIILPGGMPGTLNLMKSDELCLMLEKAEKEEKLLAAICAAPMIFGELGFLKGRKATCYPGFETHFSGGEYTGEAVTVDKNIITAKGAGAALLFGAEIVNYFIPGKGEELLLEMQF